MSGPGMDFETLTKETIDLSQNLSFDFEKFDDNFFKNNSNLFSEIDDEEAFSVGLESAPAYEGPGVVYYIEKGVSTFCIRGLVSDDLAWEQDLLESKDKDFLKLFRLTENELDQIEKIGFFPTPSLEIAESIVKIMMNRRFPVAEASLCNLSDPGFSWWMDQGESEIKIYFQSHSIDRDKLLIQLGPLGDPMVAAKMMQKASATLKHFFPIKEYSITNKSIAISCCENGIESFSELARVFSDGNFSWEEILSMGSGPHYEVLHYLHQISYKRRFWRLVTEL